MAESNEANGSRVEYPIVTIKGVEYRVKFGLGALYRLEKLGLNIQDLGISTASTGNLNTIFSILAATLGNEGKHGWVPLGLTPEQLADAIPMEMLGELSAAISQAVPKVAPAVEIGAAQPEDSQPR
jgi:hypothetical protein